jgi:hypothetical protein
VRHPASARLRNTGAVKRQLLLLVAAVVVVDACFIAGYFLFDLNAAGNPARIGYTAAWTVVTLLVVLRFLTRIRSLRGR